MSRRQRLDMLEEYIKGLYVQASGQGAFAGTVCCCIYQILQILKKDVVMK